MAENRCGILEDPPTQHTVSSVDAAGWLSYSVDSVSEVVKLCALVCVCVCGEANVDDDRRTKFENKMNCYNINKYCEEESTTAQKRERNNELYTRHDTTKKEDTRVWNVAAEATIL